MALFARVRDRNDRSLAAVASPPAPAVSPVLLGARSRRTDPGPNSRLRSEPPEEPKPRLVDHLKLSLGFVHSESIQGGFLGLVD